MNLPADDRPADPAFAGAEIDPNLDATRSISEDDQASRLAHVLDQYLAELQAGRHPDRQKILAEHPDLADQLASCFSGIEFIHRASAPKAVAGGLTQLGDFRIVREVGRGGMGVVYEAEQISLKRRVALKVLRYGAAADSEAMQRFQREAETVAGLHHTNIVPIFAIGCENGVNYYAMQFIEGQSLAGVAESLRGSDPSHGATELRSELTTIANWGLQAAEALAHAHLRGVIHRDIKPSNLILDPDGRIWLTDFGLAKRMDDVSLSMAGAILGTPRYMSPEQASAAKNPIDHRTDIYSLGATLYELATGRPLFEADSAHAVISQILTAEPAAPRQVRPSLPRDLETIILKCLAKGAEQRYATAQALADDLRAFVEGRAIRARRATLAEQAARWLKQQRRSVGVAAATVAATLFVLVSSLVAWQAHSQAQLGYLTLETPRDTNLHADVAQVMTLDNEPVGSPFTLPTKEPLPLAAGAYRLRLTAPAKLSRDYLFDVNAGQQLKFDVGLKNEIVGYPISLKSPVGIGLRSFESLSSFDHEKGLRGPKGPKEHNAIPKLFVGPQDADRPRMRCYAANSEPGWKPDGTREAEVKPLWEADWSVNSPLVKPLLDDNNNENAWKLLLRWFEPWWQVNGQPPQLVQPMCDLDGDGIDDPIWRGPQTNPQGPPHPLQTSVPLAELVAASGKDGRPLWWYRAQDHNGSVAQLLGDPVLTLKDPAQPKLLTVLRTAGAVWLEAFDAKTGKSIWKFEIASGSGLVNQNSLNWAMLEVAPLPGDSTRSFVMAAASRYAVGVDLATGKSLWGPHDLGISLLEIPRFADLDADGIPEVVHSRQIDGRGFRDVAFSMTQGKALWDVPSSKGIGAWHYHEARHVWPLAADLDGDNKPEIILPGIREEGSEVSDGCRVINGLTGEARWTRRIPRRAGFTHWRPEQFIIAPDLNGDGHREVIMASVRSEYRQPLAREFASHQHEEQFVYVDCFSGRDGHSLWWQSLPMGMTEYASMTGTVGGMLWWPSGARFQRADQDIKHVGNVLHGTQLVIPIYRHPDTQADGGIHSLYILSAATGRVEQQADDMVLPQLVDWNNDGLDDLAVYMPDDPVRFPSRGYWPPSVSGKWVVLRGSPPEAFRRLDRWIEEQDFDGDGIAELSQPMGGRGVDYSVQIASGRDGRIISRWRTDWPETPHTFTVGDLQSFPAPLGDFDGDGLADLLITRDLRFWDIEQDAPELMKNKTVPLLMQAVSGKTGQRIWGGPKWSLPDALRPESTEPRSAAWQAARMNQVSPSMMRAVDLDRDGQPELLMTLRVSGHQPDKKGGFTPINHQELQLTLIDSRRGTVRWSEPCTELLGKGGEHLSSAAQLLLEASADLNGDGTLDILLQTATKAPDDSSVGNIQAYSGRDGKPLWKPGTRPWAWFNSQSDAGPVPRIGDLDGDGKPELVLLETKTPMVVKALRGDTGEELWKWKGALPPNFTDPSLVIVAAGSSRGHVAVTTNEAGNQWEIALLDHAGQLVERQPCGSSQLWSHDLDGDGFDELLRSGNNKITASHGLHDTMWEWSHPAEFGYAWVSGFDRAPNGRVIAVVASGDGLALLDGPTGKPLGRTWTSANTRLTENNRVVGLNQPRLVEPFDNSRLLSRVDSESPLIGHVVSRTVLPADEDGRYWPGGRGSRRAEHEQTDRLKTNSSGSAGASPSQLNQVTTDPRFVRQLPWAPSTGEWAAGKLKLLQHASLFAGLSFAIVLIPFWLIRAGIRRKELGWWRVALIVAGASVFATSLIVFRFAPSGAIWRDAPWLIPIEMGLAALPAIVWTATLLRTLITGEWRRLSYLLVGTTLAATAMAAFLLFIDAKRLPAEAHYSDHAWWFILLFGAHATGALLVLWNVFSPGVRWFWRFSRRKLARTHP